MITRRILLGGLGTAAALSLFTSIRQTEVVETTRRGPMHGPQYFPNPVLITHEGKALKFYDDMVKNKLVVINMMYTQCDGRCPTTIMNMKEVHKALGGRVGQDIFMYSITLQPEFDTQSVLKNYAMEHGIEPGWQFLTGKRADIEAIRYKLGFYDLDPMVDADRSQHTGMVRIGNDAYQRWFMAAAAGDAESIVQVISHVDRA